MQTQNLQLLRSLQRSVQKIGNLYKMVKLAPVEVEAATVTEFASLIENLLTDFYQAVPKMCAPMVLFNKLQSQNLALGKIISRYQVADRKSLIEIRILEDKLRQYEMKQIILLAQNKTRDKKSDNTKQSIKEIGVIGNEIKSMKKKDERRSLPRLDLRGRLNSLNLNWDITPSPQNKRFINHLMNK